MLETRVHETKIEAEALYRKMSGEDISIQVIASTKTSLAGADSPTKTLHVHPDLILPIDEAKKLCPEKRSKICGLLRKNKEMFQRARRAILAHEVAHIYLGHTFGNWHRSLATLLMLPIGVLILPYFSTISFFIVLLAIWKLAVIFLTPLRDLSEKDHEYQADLRAVQTTKDLKGAIYFLKSGIPLAKRFSYSHPSPLERIRYLKKYYAN